MYISLAACNIYRDGAIIGELHTPGHPDIFTEATSRFGIRCEAEIFPPEHYVWEWPHDGFVTASPFTEDLEQFYRQIALHACPASVLISVNEAIVGGSVIYCATTGGFEPIYETQRSVDRAAAPTMPLATLAAAKRAAFHDEATDYLFVGSAGSSNYGHWLVDDLPRLRAVDWMLARSDDRSVCVVLTSFGEHLDRVRTDTVAALFGDRVRVEWLAPGVAVRFATLYYVSPVSQHPTQKSPTAMRYAATQAKRWCLPPETTRHRLFVARGPEHGRSLVNEGPIRALLDEFGFDYVVPEELAFIEQTRLFAGASIVVGSMGAAMTNTLFCPADVQLIYLAPAGWIEPFYFDLAVTAGQKGYSVLFGAVESPDLPPHLSAFKIDTVALRTRLERLCGA